jgi:sorting nexin-25
VRLVQFWIVVDGIRNPLEVDTDDAPDHISSFSTWTDSDRADLAQIHETYLSKPELKILPEARKAVAEFLKAGRAATPLQYSSARRLLLEAQTAAYDQLQEPYFRRFKKSNLYYKWLAMDEAANSGNSGVKTTTVARTLDDPSSVAPAMSRTQSGQKLQVQPPHGDLRRAVASSSDLKSQGLTMTMDQPRRSLDAGTPTLPRAALFDDDYDNDPLGQSTTSLDSDHGQDRTSGNDPHVVDAMHAALTDIMGDEPEGSIFYDASGSGLLGPDSQRGSVDLPRALSPSPLMQHRPLSPSPITQQGRDKPSIASLGLVGEPKTRGVFNDDLFGDEEKFLEDEIEDPVPKNTAEDDEIHEAAPGDLGLAEAIDALTADIERLVTQESIVDSLTTKAELTNNAAELRILRKSKASLQREIQRKELQRQQYIVQESDNSLYGRATVFIQSIMVGTEEDGKEYAMCR